VNTRVKMGSSESALCGDAESSTVRVGEYELGGKLGKGGFSLVWEAIHVQSRARHAIKAIDLTAVSQQKARDALREVTVLARVRPHRNVVSLLDVIISPTHVHLVLELSPSGQLFDHVLSSGPLSETMACGFFRQLVCGLSHCHMRGVCHRDLKPENLLLDQRGVLRISDFGLAKWVGDTVDAAATPSNGGHGGGDDTRASRDGGGGEHYADVRLFTNCGTPHYVAPEVIAEQGYNGFHADLWSSAVVLYVMLCGRLPFDEPSLPLLFARISQADYTLPPRMSAGATGLLRSMLVVEPELRMRLPQVASHEWLAQSPNGGGGGGGERGASAAPANNDSGARSPSRLTAPLPSSSVVPLPDVSCAIARLNDRVAQLPRRRLASLRHEFGDGGECVDIAAAHANAQRKAELAALNVGKRAAAAAKNQTEKLATQLANRANPTCHAEAIAAIEAGGGVTHVVARLEARAQARDASSSARSARTNQHRRGSLQTISDEMVSSGADM
jgi:serine/threonine protein kinase